MAGITLTGAQTSIRPLGEEHLRMFRRRVGSVQEAPKIALPVTKPKVILSKKKTNARNIPKHIKPGYRIATLEEAMMDLAFVQKLERLKGARVFVGWSGSTPKRSGHYKINRRGATRLKEIEPHQRAQKFERHERLYYSDSALAAVRKQRPLELCFDNDTIGDRIFAGSSPGVSNVFAQVAQVKEGD